MPRIYRDGVVRNVSSKDASKLKSEKNYKAADNKAIKKELAGKKKQNKTSQATSE